MTPVFTVVGGGRRAALFAGACRGQGLPEPVVLDWRDVLGGAAIRVEPGTLLRIDSPGEEADALLRGPGDPTRVAGGARWYETFTAGLRRIEAAAGDARLLGDPGEIAVMFDKRRCHRRLAAAG